MAPRARAVWANIAAGSPPATLPAPATRGLRTPRHVPRRGRHRRLQLPGDRGGARPGDADAGVRAPPHLVPGLDPARDQRGPGLPAGARPQRARSPRGGPGPCPGRRGGDPGERRRRSHAAGPGGRARGDARAANRARGCRRRRAPGVRTAGGRRPPRRERLDARPAAHPHHHRGPARGRPPGVRPPRRRLRLHDAAGPRRPPAPRAAHDRNVPLPAAAAQGGAAVARGGRPRERAGPRPRSPTWRPCSTPSRPWCSSPATRSARQVSGNRFAEILFRVPAGANFSLSGVGRGVAPRPPLPPERRGGPGTGPAAAGDRPDRRRRREVPAGRGPRGRDAGCTCW